MGGWPGGFVGDGDGQPLPSLLTVQLYLTQSSQNREAENFFRITTVMPWSKHCPIPTMFPEGRVMGAGGQRWGTLPPEPPLKEVSPGLSRPVLPTLTEHIPPLVPGACGIEQQSLGWLLGPLELTPSSCSHTCKAAIPPGGAELARRLLHLIFACLGHSSCRKPPELSQGSSLEPSPCSLCHPTLTTPFLMRVSCGGGGFPFFILSQTYT